MQHLWSLAVEEQFYLIWPLMLTGMFKIWHGRRRPMLLATLGMTDPVDEPPVEPSLECRSSGWVRARRTGILHLDAHLGQKVSDGERLGTLFDSFGKTLRAVYANRDGIVIGPIWAPSSAPARRPLAWSRISATNASKTFSWT